MKFCFFVVAAVSAVAISNSAPAADPIFLMPAIVVRSEERTPIRPVNFDDLTLPGRTDADLPPSEERGNEFPALTVADFEGMALTSNPTLRQAGAAVDQARGNWQQVGLYPNPVVGYSAEEIGDQDTAGQQGGFVQQTIVTGRKLKLNRAVAAQDIREAKWQLDAQRGRVLTDVRLRFFEALGAQRKVELAHELVENAQQGRMAVQDLLDAEQVSEADLTQAEVQLEQARLDLETARTRADAAWRRLVNVAGRPGMHPVPLTGPLNGEKIPLFEEVWERVRLMSPELQRAEATIDRARAQICRERAVPIPDVFVQASVRHDFASEFTVFGAQLGVPVPVFNRNEGNISAAVAALQRAVEDRRRLELVLRDRMAGVYQAYDAARVQVRSYQMELIPRAAKGLELATAGYESGQFGILRVLATRQIYFETRQRSLEAQIELRKRLVEMDGLLLRGGLQEPGTADVNAGGGGGGSRRLTTVPKTE